MTMKIQKLSLSPFHWNEIIEVVVEYYKMGKKKTTSNASDLWMYNIPWTVQNSNNQTGAIAQ